MLQPGALAGLESRIAGLARLERQLRKDFDVLLGSRRWRIGDTVFTLANRVLMRRTRNTIPDRLSAALARHEASRRSLPKPADRPYDSVSTASGPTADEPRDLLQPGTFPTGREARPAAGPKQDDLRFFLYERQLEELEQHVERLVSLGEALLSSRRWRFGAWLASVPHRLLLRPPPLTTAASLSMHVRNFRFVRASPPVEPAIDVPEPPQPGPKPQTRPPAISAEPVPPATPVDIVVCVHNALDDVRRCLRSITAKTSVDFRLFVVNDGSDEETTRWLRRFAARIPNVETIQAHGPLGYTRAANLGLRASSAEFVVLLNSDTIVPRLWLEALLECIASDAKIGIAGPVSNAATWQSIPETLDGQGGWAVNRLPPGYNVDEFSELVRLKSARQFPRAGLVNGFCLMIRREVIERIGYLDEASFPRGYGEENDYCLRARDAGIEIAIADHCFVYHAKSRSFGSAARDSLAARGRKRLKAKYGQERIRRSTEPLRDSPVLADLRRAVAQGLATAGTLANARPGSDYPGPRSTDPGVRNVLFILPVKGGSGGANSVIQEVAGMRQLGIDARVVTHEQYRDRFRRFYREQYDSGDFFLFFDSNADLMALSEPFDIIVATLWSTPAQIEPIARHRPRKVYIYYVQDYEPFFFPHDPDLQSEAAESYTLMADMALMAKTDWICRTVRERHGREVYRVAPSLDHQVYFAGSYRNKPAEGQKEAAEGVTIAAMIRPSTPRRAPMRTLRALREAATRTGAPTRAVIFGCEAPELRTHLQRHAPGFRLDFPVENRGLLTRNQVADLLREADVFLDLSDYQAFGRTGLEAMACGCATVLTAHGGSYEYALDGENCLLVDVTSSAEIAAAVNRLVDDRDLRQRIQSNAVATAARYSVLRASLSELSVFRLVASLRRRGRQANAISYRRAVEPVVAEPAPVSLSVLAVSAATAAPRPFSPMEARILRPLRHPSLRNRLRVQESVSLQALGEQRPAICVVAGTSIEEASMAREIVKFCRESGARLIYETDERPGARAGAETAVRLLATAADRVIVPSRSLREAYSGLNTAVKVLPAAIDEELWMERSIPGERLLGERRSPHEARLVSLSGGAALARVAGCWPGIPEAAHTTVSLQVFGGFDDSPGSGWEIMPHLEGDLEDAVSRLRAANCWDIALLPADANTPDADLQFLGYAALGLTILCSDEGPHMQFARHAENAIVVGGRPPDWRAAILRSIGDADFREALGARALYDVDARHSLKRRALDFHTAYCDGLA